MIVIDNDDDDETLTGFMPSYNDSEIDSFLDSIFNLVQRALKRIHNCRVFSYLE